MALIQWSPELSLNVPRLDIEHQHLIALVNTLYDGYQRGQNARSLERIFRELVEAASMHFESEESFLEEQGYPESDAHKEEHEVLLGQLLDLQGRVSAGRSGINAETFEYLCDWVVDHIVNADKEFAAYVKGAGVR